MSQSYDERLSTPLTDPSGNQFSADSGSWFGKVPKSPRSAAPAPVQHHMLDQRERKLMSAFEGLDYEVVESELYREREATITPGKRTRIIVAEWIITFLIGASTGFTAFVVDLCVKYLFSFKFYITIKLLEGGNLIGAYLAFLPICMLFVLIATILVSYIEPVACGSGIPEMKGYLNGANLKNAVELRTLLVKATGVTFSVASGLPIGKEGPMVHVGSCFAANWSHLPRLPGLFGSDSMNSTSRYFRTDHFKRDFVAGGCAAGVAAAFGAPVGGILFALEEAASYWSLGLTWRSFFCAMVSTFTLNVFRTGVLEGRWDNVDSPGLLDFGDFKADAYKLYEIPAFALIAVGGGLLGAAFCAINLRLSHVRIKYINPYPFRRVIEALCVSAVVSTCTFWVPYGFNDQCMPMPEGQGTGYNASRFGLPQQYTFVRYQCPENHYNPMATILFTTQENGIHALFHDDIDTAAFPDGHALAGQSTRGLGNRGQYIPTFSYSVLFAFGAMYFVLACYVYGLAVPSGLFVPSILIGGALARIMGVWLSEHSILGLFGSNDNIQPGLYAFIGSSAMLGGVTRMTISLTIILVETTNDVQYLMPVMLTVMIAKWVGDIFNISLYDIHVELKCIPFVEPSPPDSHTHLKACDIMQSPVTAFRTQESVGVIHDRLAGCKHNGFPVINHANELVGIVIRNHMQVLLSKKAWEGSATEESLSVDDFSTTVSSLPTPLPDVSTEEREHQVDLLRIMNPAPFSVQEDCPASRVFRLFRSMGLRHLVVCGTHNELLGVITRKNLRTDFYQRRTMEGSV